jgi:peptidoglycan/LPS O-acetylase OafA/YrhL
MVYIGIWLASTAFFQEDPLKKLKTNTWMAWPGNHSLAIYLVHQPALFAMFGLIAYLSNP